MKLFFLTLFFSATLFADIAEDGYRIYDESTIESVKEFYKRNHENQTLDFVLQKKREYLPLNRAKMTLWEAIELLDRINDESDPDLSLPQSYHAYQTAEALRKANLPRWLVVTGFIHDLGKILTYFGEPQWAVVGDTFPVGCDFSKKIVFSHYFENNPDFKTFDQWGIYQEHCGFDQLHMSWGHDEYLYQITKPYLPIEALYIIRYHSFYPAHRDGEYGYFMDDFDQEMLPWLKLFCQYDLYSKSEEVLDINELRPYYEVLVSEFFGEGPIDW